jgi:hypothetical protein
VSIMGYDDGSGAYGYGGGSMGVITSILQRLGTGLGKAVRPVDQGATSVQRQGRPMFNVGATGQPQDNSAVDPQNTGMGLPAPVQSSASSDWSDTLAGGIKQAVQAYHQRSYNNQANSYAQQMNNAGFATSPSDYNQGPSWATNAPLGAGAQDEDLAIEQGASLQDASAMTDAASSTGAGAGGGAGAGAGGMISSLIGAYAKQMKETSDKQLQQAMRPIVVAPLMSPNYQPVLLNRGY